MVLLECESMNIGFDLDGVVFHQDLGLLRVIDNMIPTEKKAECFRYYCKMRTMQINPIDFLHAGDRLFFITGRNENVALETQSWQLKYFPNATLIMTNLDLVGNEENMADWDRRQAEAKFSAIIHNKIDVYFEDNPAIVMTLRDLIAEYKLQCKVIQYGGR